MFARLIIATAVATIVGTLSVGNDALARGAEEPTEEAAALQVGIGTEPVGRETIATPELALAPLGRGTIGMGRPPTGTTDTRHLILKANGIQRPAWGAIGTGGQTCRVNGTRCRASEAKIIITVLRISTGNGTPATMAVAVAAEQIAAMGVAAIAALGSM